MSGHENISVLRRKIKARNVQSQTGGSTVQKALRQAFARAAQDDVALEVIASGCTEARLGVEDIVQNLDNSCLLMLLNGPEAAHGLAVVDFQVVAALVEHLTTGRVVPGEAAARNATRTDAMMLSGLLDSVLIVFDAELGLIPDTPPCNGFRHMVVLQDMRAVTMALEQVSFRHFQLSLDLGRGAKTGGIGLYSPYDPPRKSNFRAQEQDVWQGKWREHVMALHAPVEAIIHRFSMSLEEVTALEVGALIQIPAAKIAEVSLEGVDGHNVASGKLGQVSGNRAIRISTQISSGPARGD